MRNRFALLASVVLVVSSFAFGVFVLAPQNTSGDFLMLWTGARLLGPDLYDWGKAAEIQHSVEHRDVVLGFVRLPIEALVLWPLAKLPTRSGARIWQVLNLCALLAFVWLWSPRPGSFVACALFPPIWWSLGFGQETCILLLLVGSAILLIERHQDFTGGFLLALCAMKPHLFLFVPVVLLAQRRWRAMGGLLVGGTVIYAISASVSGLDWPLKFLESVARNRQEFRLFSPGLSLAFTYFSVPGWLIALTQAAIAGVVYLAVQEKPWLTSALFALAAGVVFAPWCWLNDLVLLLPPLLSMMPAEFVIVAGFAMLALGTPGWPLTDSVLLALTWHARPRRPPTVPKPHRGEPVTALAGRE